MILLALLFWASEFLVIALVLAPVHRFIKYGWEIRKQDFTNRLANKNIDFYFQRFWRLTLKSATPGKHDLVVTQEDKFHVIYDILVSKKLYYSPWALLVFTVFIFGGLVISTALRAGYEEYILYYVDWAAKEKGIAAQDLSHIGLGQIRTSLLPFSMVMLSFQALAAITGAYLYVVGVLISGYRKRTLTSSDLWWCSFRMIIACPLGYSLAALEAESIAPFIGFALGAFPMESVNRILRRLLNVNLKLEQPDDNGDNLGRMLGVTPDIAAALNLEGIGSAQQLSDEDPVSLSIRSGLSFDYVLSLVSQSQAWSFIGATAGKLAPFGLGDARMIAKLVCLIDREDENAEATLNGAAKIVEMDREMLLFNFRNISEDDYTKFLIQISAGSSRSSQT